MLRSVPNAPCGVERPVSHIHHINLLIVPNAPCGVESRWACIYIDCLRKFLMHRVELKDAKTKKRTNKENTVPNAPCGVESVELNE